MPSIGKIVCLALLAMLTGCAQRTLIINSEPQGALVYLNQEEVGRTPLKYDFTWYADYDVTLRKEGYETLKTHRKLKAPIYMWAPFDLLSEMVGVKDKHEWTFALTPADPRAADPDELVARAQQFKGELRSTKYTRSPMTQPSATLDFRVAAQVGGDTSEQAGNRLPADVATQCIRDLEKSGPHGGQERIKGFEWFEVESADVTNWISGVYEGRRYILLMSVDPYIMLAEQDGRRQWGLERVYLAKDAQEHTAIGFDFDAAGAERFGKLTETNLNQPLATLIDGKVISVPTIRSKITASGMISGGPNGFDPATAQNMVTALSQSMPPTTASSTQ